MRQSIAPVCALTIACGHAIPTVAPAPVGTFVAGDANGDGFADVSDAVWLSSTLFRGGERGACFAATDIVADGALTAADVFTLQSAVMAGDSVLKDLGDACAGAAEPEAPGPVALAMDLDVPRKVKGPAGGSATIDAAVLLYTPDSPVQAWNLSISAEGCAVSALTTEGTDGGSVYDEPPGQRGATSYDYHALTPEGGAVAGVILDWRADNVLSARDDPWTLLALTLQATPPDKGCGTCTVSLHNGERADGPALRNLATVGGWTYPLPRVDHEIEVCAE